MFAINFFFPTILMKFEVSKYASYLAPMVLEYVNIVTGILGSWLVKSPNLMFFGLFPISVWLLQGHYSVVYPPCNEVCTFFGFLVVHSVGYGLNSSRTEVDFPRRAMSIAVFMMMTSASYGGGVLTLVGCGGLYYTTTRINVYCNEIFCCNKHITMKKFHCTLLQ